MNEEKLFKLKAVYAKYKHLDKLICDTNFNDEFPHVVLRHLWEAIKFAVVES